MKLSSDRTTNKQLDRVVPTPKWTAADAKQLVSENFIAAGAKHIFINFYAFIIFELQLFQQFFLQ